MRKWAIFTDLINPKLIYHTTQYSNCQTTMYALTMVFELKRRNLHFGRLCFLLGNPFSLAILLTRAHKRTLWCSTFILFNCFKASNTLPSQQIWLNCFSYSISVSYEKYSLLYLYRMWLIFAYTVGFVFEWGIFTINCLTRVQVVAKKLRYLISKH